MSEARAFQAEFGALLFGPGEPSDPALRRAVAVHRNTGGKAAIDALAANYPVIAALVGDEPFRACASAHVSVMPPADPRLCLYGERFATFIDAWTPFVQAPYLRSVAIVERFVTEALFAAEVPLLDPALVSDALDAEAPLHLHPATRFFMCDWPAATIWLAHLESASSDALETMDWKPEAILVTRPRLAVEVRIVDAATLNFLSAATIAEAAVAASRAGGDVAEIFSALLIAGAFAASANQGVSQ